MIHLTLGEAIKFGLLGYKMEQIIPNYLVGIL